MRRLAPALLAAAALAACAKTDWSAKLQADPLLQRADALRASATCGALVPMEFGWTIPVPARDGGYKVLFYPLSSSPGRSEAFSPVVEGVLPPAGEGTCAKIAGAKPESRGPAVPPALAGAEYDRRQAAVYGALEAVAGAYRRGGASSPDEKKVLAEFAESFASVAEPGLLPDYYRANPDFWEWLRREAGRSIPKA